MSDKLAGEIKLKREKLNTQNKASYHKRELNGTNKKIIPKEQQKTRGRKPKAIIDDDIDKLKAKNDNKKPRGRPTKLPWSGLPDWPSIPNNEALRHIISMTTHRDHYGGAIALYNDQCNIFIISHFFYGINNWYRAGGGDKRNQN